jgi:pyruvate decarboxylase
MYEKMAREITAETVVLSDATTAAADIDHALNTMMQQSRPVYIGVPTDIAFVEVSDEGLATPLQRDLPADDSLETQKTVQEIRSLLEKASNPIIIVDGGEGITISNRMTMINSFSRSCSSRFP